MTQDELEFASEYCTPEAFIALTNALMFYADPETYFAMSVFADRPCGEFADDIGEILEVNERGEQVGVEYRHGHRACATFESVLSFQSRSCANNDRQLSLHF